MTKSPSPPPSAGLPSEGARSVDVHGNASGVISSGDNARITIYQQRTNEIGLVITAEGEQVELDREIHYYLEVNNRTLSPRRLRITAEGVSNELVCFSPENPFDLAGHDKTTVVLGLRCTRSAPMAGPIPLRIVITDIVTGQVVLEDTPPTKMTVPANPHVKAELLPKKVFAFGRHSMQLHLSNSGNTTARGTVDVLSPIGSEPQVLEASRIILAEKAFDLKWHDRQGNPRELRLDVIFPLPSLVDHTWTVLLVADIKNHEQRECIRCEATQIGLLSEGRRHFAKATRRISEWCRRERTGVRQGWLAFGGALLLLVGLTIGAITANHSTSALDAPLLRAGPAKKSAVSSAPAATKPTPSSTAGPVYVSLPCSPGQSVAFLAALTEQQSSAYETALVDYYSRRVQYLAEADGSSKYYSLRVSRRGNVCAASLGVGYLPAKVYQVFVWAGPMSTADASALCNILRQQISCVAMPTG
jgi:hypothetical protein